MHGPLESSDPNRLRVSDAERHQVAEILREAAGEGRIDLTELDERLEATYAAKTYADLVPITSDLASRAHQPQEVTRPAATSPYVTEGAAVEHRFAILSGYDRRGVWVVPEHLKVLALLGGVELDMREARFAAHEVVVTINAFMGGASIILGPHINVVIEGLGIMGGYSGPSGLVAAQLDHHSPTVRVRGVAIWGGVSVERKEMPGTSRGRPGRA